MPLFSPGVGIDTHPSFLQLCSKLFSLLMELRRIWGFALSGKEKEEIEVGNKVGLLWPLCSFVEWPH